MPMSDHYVAVGDEQRHRVHRGSVLTRVLFESCTRPGSRLAAIGTLAPAATDFEHTMCMLRTLQPLLSDSANSGAASIEHK